MKFLDLSIITVYLKIPRCIKVGLNTVGLPHLTIGFYDCYKVHTYTNRTKVSEQQ